MISLSATAAANASAGKQFVARITGRDSKFTFRREFIGRKEGKRGAFSRADVDSPGLYETRDVDRKGYVSDSYCVLQEVDGDLCRSVWIGKDVAMKIATALDDGRRLEAVCSLFQRPSQRDPSRMVWDVELVTPRQAEAKAVAQTIDKATEACWQVLAALPEAQAKKVLAALRQRVAPPKAAAAVGLTADAPSGVVADANQAGGVSAEQMALTPTPVIPEAPDVS